MGLIILDETCISIVLKDTNHEVNLASCSSRFGRGEKDFVISFTEKLELLCLLMHEDTVQMPRLHIANLNGFVTPSHNLRMDGTAITARPSNICHTCTNYK